MGGLFVLLWLAISSSLYAPWWGVVLLIALIVPQAVLVARWARPHPTRCVWVPVVGLVLWFIAVQLGVAWDDWSV